MNLKPRREIVVPHPDALEGTLQQSEFAADITTVRTGKAGHEYGDATAFAPPLRPRTFAGKRAEG